MRTAHCHGTAGTPFARRISVIPLLAEGRQMCGSTQRSADVHPARPLTGKTLIAAICFCGLIAAAPLAAGELAWPEGSGSVFLQPPHQINGSASDTAHLFFGDPAWSFPVDDVTLTEPATVRRVRWWAFYGGHVEPDPHPPLGDEIIRIRFRAPRDGDGLPGDILYEESFFNPTRVATGERIAIGAAPDEYQFEADLATPFDMVANTLYWVEIAQLGDLDSYHNWESGGPPGGNIAFRSNYFPEWQYVSNSNRAFELLTIPEPMIASLLCLIIGIGLIRRGASQARKVAGLESASNMNRLFVLIATTVLLTGSPHSVADEIAWIECNAPILDHPPTQTGGPASDTLFMGSVANWQRLADDFVLDEPATLRRITWWGFFGPTFDALPFQALPPDIEIFRVRIYDERPVGLPGNVLFEESYFQPLRAATVNYIIDGSGHPEYVYQADLFSLILLGVAAMLFSPRNRRHSPTTKKAAKEDRLCFAQSNSVVGCIVVFFVCHFATPVNAQTCSAWNLVQHFGNRSGHAMAFDQARGKTVHFGGIGDAPLDVVYEWDGSIWRPGASAGPSSRQHPGICYDIARGVVVLFGGASFSGSSLGDTWEWNGRTWTLRATGGPSPRHRHALAFDTVRGVSVLFGGANSNGYLDDTWEWDGSSWIQRTAPGPSARFLHAMTFDPSSNSMMLFGGMRDGLRNSETWSWSGTAWTLWSTSGPSPRFGHAMCTDDLSGRALLFGGFDGQVRDDFWQWGNGTWSQIGSTGPSPRDYTALAFDSVRSRVVLMGGADDFGPLGDTWEWDGASWLQMADRKPSHRFWTAMAHDTYRHMAVLFGGSGLSDWLTDTWEWNGFNWRQTLISGPPGRGASAMCYDSIRNVCVLHGGLGDQGLLNDTWELDGTTWTLKSTDGPAVYWHAMSFDCQRSVSVLFGGEIQNNAYSNETWEWDGLAWTLRSQTGPVPTRLHGMAYDIRRGVTVLFGGGYTPTARQTWEWDGQSWLLRAENGPQGIYNTPLVYDESRGLTFMVSTSAVSPNVVRAWSWDGAAWTQYASALAPAIRYGQAASLDPHTNDIILLGGYWNSLNNQSVMYDDFWRFTPGTPSILSGPQSLEACEDAGVTLTVEAQSPTPMQYQWFKDALPIPGATGDAYALPSVALLDQGLYHVVVTNACGSTTSAAAELGIHARGSGDVNSDGVANGRDIQSFVGLLLTPPPADDLALCAADCNSDGQLSVDDVEPFVLRMLDG